MPTSRGVPHPIGTRARWSRIALPYSVLRLGGQVTEFFGWAVLARRLGTAGFGELSIVFLICRYAGIIADWGAVMRGPRDIVGRSGGSVRGYIHLRTKTAFALSAAGVLFLSLTGRPHLIPVIAVVVSLGLSRDWVALGRGLGIRAATPIFIQGIIIATTSVSVTSLGMGAVAVGAGYSSSALMSVLLNRLPGDRAEGTHSNDAWMLAAALANQITSSIDIVLLGILASSSAAGIYAAVYRIPNAWVAVLSALLAGLLPTAAMTLIQGEQQFRQLRRRSMKMSGAAAVVMAILAPVGALMVPMIFGNEYQPGRGAVSILLLATAVITMSSPLHPLAVSGGSDRLYSLILVSGALINLIANLGLIPAFGMTGAATATLGSQIYIGIALWVLVQRQAVDRMART